MSATTPNGIPPELSRSDSTTSLGKRKRDGSDDHQVIKTEDTSTESSQLRLEEVLKDVLEVLKSSDYAPSIISHPLPSSRSSEEPNTKRARLADGSHDVADNATIQSRIESGSYESVDDFLSDIDTVSSSLTIRPAEKENLPNGFRHSSLQNDDDTLVPAFKKYVRDLLRPYATHNSSVKDEEKEDGGKMGHIPQDRRTVLTLFGHAPNTQIARQVFSSLQQPQHVHVGPATAESTVEVFTPFREVGLPNGITPSNVLPFHPTDQLDAKRRKIQSFVEIFAPPSSIPDLKPPAQSRHTLTISEKTVKWYNPDDADPTSATIRTSQGNRTNYKQTPLHTGQWLRYSTRPLKQTGRPETQRKLTGDKSMSLFRKAYGGVGPARDNSEAVVAEDIMDQYWWKTFGEQRLSKYVSQEDPDMGMTESVVADIEFDEQEIMEAVERAGQDIPKEFKGGDEMDTDEISKSTEEVLGEISDLLETLGSYQGIRNLSIASTSRSVATSSTQVGTSEPSSAEFDVYEMLKTSLSLMIESLPPHAIARLDGDRLKDLNIGSKVLVENANYRGTMAEDDYSLRVRESLNTANSTALRPTVAPYAANTRAPSYQSPTPQAQYTPRPGFVSQPSAVRPSQPYQPQLNYPGRPMSSAQYSTNQPQTYPNRQTQSPSTSQRPAFPPSQYSQSGGPQYSQGGSQQIQRPVQNGYSHTSPPNGTPAPQSYPSRPPNQGYGPRSPEGNYSPLADARSASPQKQPTYTPQQTQSRNSYAASANSTTQPRYFQQQHHPSQYGQYPQAKSPPVNHSGVPSLGSYMTAAEQAILMDRGRQQIAQQTRQGSGTPQPPNGQHAPSTPIAAARSGTPGTPAASAPVQQALNGNAVAGGQ